MKSPLKYGSELLAIIVLLPPQGNGDAQYNTINRDVKENCPTGTAWERVSSHNEKEGGQTASGDLYHVLDTSTARGSTSNSREAKQAPSGDLYNVLDTSSRGLGSSGIPVNGEKQTPSGDLYNVLDTSNRRGLGSTSKEKQTPSGDLYNVLDTSNRRGLGSTSKEKQTPSGDLYNVLDTSNHNSSKDVKQTLSGDLYNVLDTSGQRSSTAAKQLSSDHINHGSHQISNGGAAEKNQPPLTGHCYHILENSNPDMCGNNDPSVSPGGILGG